MVDKLIEALSENIISRWGEEYKVYTEKVYQNAVKPCFFLECESVDKVQLLGGRFFLRVTVKLVLDSDSDEKNCEAEKLLGEIFLMMNSVKKDERVFNGRKIHCSYEDGNMVIKGVYDLFIRQEEEAAELMEYVELRQEELG